MAAGKSSLTAWCVNDTPPHSSERAGRAARRDSYPRFWGGDVMTDIHGASSSTTPLPGLRPEPASGLGHSAGIASARKRNWRGHFVKTLRDTPEGSREWLIWSRYHNAWHCRDAT